VEQKELKWNTFEYEPYKKGSDWYWMVGIISISIVVISLIFNNILFGLFVLLGTFTLVLYASRVPSIISIEITKSGITMGKYRFPYSSLESFWVETEEGRPRIILKSKKILMPHHTIFTETIDPEIVRDFLAEYLTEEEQSEPVHQQIMDRFGF